MDEKKNDLLFYVDSLAEGKQNNGRNSYQQKLINFLDETRKEPFHLCIYTDSELMSPGPDVIKLFSCSTQLSMKSTLLIKIKILKDNDIPCLKKLRCCIYPAFEC